MFDWKDEYSVNIESIDLQHKKLLEIGEGIATLLTKAKERDIYDELVSQITELKDYTIYHFAEEEKVMIKYGYVNFDEHKNEHTDFIMQIQDIDLEELDANQVDHVKDLMKFVAKWVLKHILGSDMKYKSYFDENNIKAE